MKDRNRQTVRLQKLFDLMRAGSRISNYDEICRIAGLDPVSADNLLYENLGMSGADFMTGIKVRNRSIPRK